MRRRETLQIQIDQTEMREQVSGRFRRIRMERVRTRIERGSNGCGKRSAVVEPRLLGIKMGPQIAQKGGQNAPQCPGHVMKRPYRRF